MAFGDESFYNIDGEEINCNVLVQKMVDYFNEKYPDSKITDFNEGSVIRNTLEGIACDVFHLELGNQNILRAVFLSLSYGRYLDLFGEELNRPRDNGSVSIGEVIFSIPEETLTELTIPAGTVLFDNEQGIEFITNGDAIISVGESSVSCIVNSVIIGTSTNVKADTITVFRDTQSINGLTVTNPEKCTGGRNIELDDEYRERLLEVRARDNFGSIEHYINLGEEVDGVHDVILTDPTNPQLYSGKIIVNGDTKPLPGDVLVNVASVYNTQSNLVYNQTFEVEAVDYTDVNLEITVGVSETVSDNIFIEVLTLIFDGGEFISASTNRNIEMTYPGVNINEGVTNYQLLTLLESLNFVVQVTSLTCDEELFKKITPEQDKVLRLGTVEITQELVE